MNDTLKNAMARKGFMPLGDAAEVSGYTTTHLSRLIDAETVVGSQAGPRQWYVSRASLAAYVGEVAAEALGLDVPLTDEEPPYDAPKAPTKAPTKKVKSRTSGPAKGTRKAPRAPRA